LKGIIFGKNIRIGWRKYPPHEIKQSRVLILTIDHAPLLHCRENPSKKASRKTTQKESVLISNGYVAYKEMAYHLLPARV
jgi:hypothetical protein